jgi:hypothetical protein
MTDAVRSSKQESGFRERASHDDVHIEVKENPVQEKQNKYNDILRYSKSIQIIAVVDFIVCLFWIAGAMYFMLFLMFMPVVGFFAGRNLSFSLTCAWIGYLVIVLLLRIILAGVWNMAIVWVL